MNNQLHENLLNETHKKTEIYAEENAIAANKTIFLSIDLEECFETIE